MYLSKKKKNLEPRRISSMGFKSEKENFFLSGFQVGNMVMEIVVAYN